MRRADEFSFGELIGAGLSAVGQAIGNLASSAYSFVAGIVLGSIGIGISLYLLSIVGWFVPAPIYATAFALAPLATTILPGVLATMMVTGWNSTSTRSVTSGHLRSSMTLEIDQDRANISTLGAAATLAAGVRYGAAILPRFAALSSPVTSWAWLSTTAIVAAAGATMGSLTKDALLPPRNTYRGYM